MHVYASSVVFFFYVYNGSTSSQSSSLLSLSTKSYGFDWPQKEIAFLELTCNSTVLWLIVRIQQIFKANTVDNCLASLKDATVISFGKYLMLFPADYKCNCPTCKRVTPMICPRFV